MIDLHCHSYFSDGLLSPEELILRAVQANLTLLALTDHDTVGGLERLHEAARQTSVKIIDGIELSARWKKHDLHIIGLNIRPQDPYLQDLISQQKERRIERAKQISTRLDGFGIENAYQKACDIAGHEHVGRPHFAQVLVKEQHVVDIQTAFKRFLGSRQKAYVPMSWVSLEDAVESIHQAGGQAVIAHPLKYKLTRTKLHELVKAFKIAGGVGLEVVSGEMNPTEVMALADLCVRFELFASSGSDYHGDSMSRVGLGKQNQLPRNCVPIWQEWSI